MSDWDRFSDWMATLAAASLAWVSSVLAPDLPIDAIEAADSLPPFANRQDLMIGWAQATDEPPIEQVGEDTGEDVETLDEATPPVEEVAPEEDIETLDEGALPVAVDEDVEPLDQGSPPATTVTPVTESPPPSDVAAPATTYVAPEPAPASGPVIPEGFGTGNVHVSTGNAAFPAGLADCRVGAVTGRAYVGIDCEEGTSVVGHAPSFEEFPFVVDAGFPFNRESVFSEMSEGVVADDADVFVSEARGRSLDEDIEVPEIRTSGASSIELTQEARNRSPRAEVDSRDAKRRADPDEGSNGKDSAAGTSTTADRVKDEAKETKRNGGKDGNGRVAAGDKDKKSKHAKKQGNQKSKKGRESKNR